MKKIRVIVAVVAVALFLMGVGYAAWSQTLNITATGSVDSTDNIRFTAASAVPVPGVSASASLSGSFPGEVANISLGGMVDGKPVGAYPGLRQSYNITVTNGAAFPIDFTGFSSFTITQPGEYDLANYVTFEVWDGSVKLGTINPNGLLTFSSARALVAGESKTYTVVMAFANNLPAVKNFAPGDGPTGSFSYYIATNYVQH